MSIGNAVIGKGRPAAARQTKAQSRGSTRAIPSSGSATAVLDREPKKAATRRQRRRDDQGRPTTVARATRPPSSIIYEEPTALSPAYLSTAADSDTLPPRCGRVDLPAETSKPEAAPRLANRATAKKGKENADVAAGTDFNDPAVRAAINHHANVAQDVLFPSRAIASLGLDDGMSVMGMRLFLARFNREAGGSERDSLFKTLTDQVAITHQRIAKLDADAERASSLEAKRLYLDASAKLRSELRKMFETVSSYRRENRAMTEQLVAAANEECESHAKKTKPRKATNAQRTRK